MSDFVEQCRDEWRRLGVPAPLAEEMATDLASDLREAEADGVSAEELLGKSTFDPRAFASAWAIERGLIPGPPSQPPHSRPPLLVAFTAIAATALVIAAGLLVTGEPQLTVSSSDKARSLALPPSVDRHVLHTSAATPIEWILLVLAIIALGFAARLWSNWSRSRPRTTTAAA